MTQATKFLGRGPRKVLPIDCCADIARSPEFTHHQAYAAAASSFQRDAMLTASTTLAATIFLSVFALFPFSIRL